MSVNHTFGPWVVADDGTIESRFGGLVGHVANVSDAHRALIAAAPELRSALSDLHLAVTMRPTGQGGLSPAERSALDRARALLNRLEA